MVTSSCLNDDTSQPYMFTSHKHYTQWNIEYYIIYPSFPQKKSPVENGNVHLSCLARCPLYPLLVAVLKLFTLSLTMSDWSKRKEPEFPELRLTGHHVHSATSLYISICIYIYTHIYFRLCQNMCQGLPSFGTSHPMSNLLHVPPGSPKPEIQILISWAKLNSLREYHPGVARVYGNVKKNHPKNEAYNTYTV